MSENAALFERARELQADTIALRRRLHRKPELGLQLPATQAAVLEALDGLGLDVRLGKDLTSVVATLDGGGDGPTILLRGDMDALPLQEDTGLEFSSEIDGAMHACGHDTHTAMLVGAARLLAELRSELPGKVLFMFQPGEEGYHGARVMLEEGMLDGHDVTGAFAIHITTIAPTGWIATRPGPQLASADQFRIVLTGRGGHGSTPHLAADPVPAACELVLALQAMVTRRVDVFDPAVLTVGRLHAGTAFNVIPEVAEVEGTVRTVSPATRELVRGEITRVAEGVGSAHGITVDVEHLPGFPVTVNDPSFNEFVVDVAGDLLGPDRVFAPMPVPTMGSEDFSYVLEQVPGSMVFLGAQPPGSTPPIPNNHSNRFVIDEDAMAAGVALYAKVAMEHLRRAAATR